MSLATTDNFGWDPSGMMGGNTLQIAPPVGGSASAANAAQPISPKILALLHLGGVMAHLLAPPNPEQGTAAYNQDAARADMGYQAGNQAGNAAGIQQLPQLVNAIKLLSGGQVAPTTTPTSSQLSITNPTPAPAATSPLSITPPQPAASAPNFTSAPAAQSTPLMGGDPSAQLGRVLSTMMLGMTPDAFKLALGEGHTIVNDALKEHQQGIENARYVDQQGNENRDYQLRVNADKRAESEATSRQAERASHEQLQQAHIADLTAKRALARTPEEKAALDLEIYKTKNDYSSSNALDRSMTMAQFALDNPKPPTLEGSNEVQHSINTAYGDPFYNAINAVYPPLVADVDPKKQWDAFGVQHPLNVSSMLDKLSTAKDDPGIPPPVRVRLGALYDKLRIQYNTAYETYSRRGNPFAEPSSNTTPTAKLGLLEIKHEATPTPVPVVTGKDTIGGASPTPGLDNSPKGQVITIRPDAIAKHIKGKIIYKQDGYLLDANGNILQKVTQ